MKRRWIQLIRQVARARRRLVAAKTCLRLVAGPRRWALSLQWRAAAAEAAGVAVISPEEIRLSAWSGLRRVVAAEPVVTTRAGESRLVADLARFRSGLSAQKGALA